MLGLNFEVKSCKTADLMKIVLVVCRLVRQEKNKGKKRKNCFCRFQISKKTVPLICSRKFFRLILKSRYVFLNFTTARILALTFNKCEIYFCGKRKGPCRVVNWFWLICHESQKCKLCNIVLYKFTANTLKCLYNPAENHKSYGQTRS